MQTYQKYTWVCTGDCDALIEYTFKDGFGWPNGVMELICPCGSNCTLVSQEDATILPTTNERQEMDSVNKEDLIAMWRQELELTYGNEITELKNKLSSHQNCDYWKSENGRVQSQIIDVVDELIAGNWTDVDDIANTLCEIIDYNPVKEIEFTATMRFTGRIEVPAREADDFDLNSVLEDAYIDINHGDVIIDEYHLEDVAEC